MCIRDRGVPALIGFVLNEYCKGPVVDGMQTYDYTLPMWIFAGFGAVSYTHLGGYAIPAFNFNNMEQMQAIIKAAVETKSPVILQVLVWLRCSLLCG